ncbi:MAG: hypothetical protein KAJ32_06255 [Gammaproteobacteria bacterium]|nr:hypothetical protein [Gammaproteobacteria bacterium]
MSLFDKLNLEELNKVINDLPFNKHQTNRKEIAHFCEHDGISIRFTRARETWHALAPCALKPWWLSLKPIRKNTKQQENKITTKNAAEKAELIEEIENA